MYTLLRTAWRSMTIDQMDQVILDIYAMALDEADEMHRELITERNNALDDRIVEFCHTGR